MRALDRNGGVELGSHIDRPVSTPGTCWPYLMRWRRSLDLAAAALIALFGVAFLLPAPSHAADGEVSRSSVVGGAAEAHVPTQIRIVETGSLDSRGAVQIAARAQNDHCGWEDAPAGATFVCLSGVPEGDERPVYVKTGDQVGQPTPVSVRSVYRYWTTPITALENIDYTPVSGSAVIEVGSSQTVIEVPTLDDTLDEFDEIFALGLEDVEGVGLFGGSRAYAVILISDNDPEPTLTIADDTAAEVDASLEFGVTLSAVSGKPITVEYATSDRTATAGNDYRATSGTLAFVAGEVAKTVAVPVLADQLPEADETMALTLSTIDNGNLGRGVATGTILDDDPALTVTGGEVAEADGTLAFAVTVTGGASTRGTVTVDYATSDGSATAGSDYTTTSGTLPFPPGVGERTVVVPVLDDRVEEGDETLTLTLTGPVNALIEGTAAVGTIRNDDLASTAIALSAVPVRVSEEAGATSVAVTATLNDSARGVETTVTVSVSGSGAAEAVDFAAVPDFAVTILAGAMSGTGTFTLKPEDDSLDEADERLSISGASNLPVTGTTLTLADDDLTTGILLTAAPSRVFEGAGPTLVTVTAALDGSARGVETTVTVLVSGSGAAEAVDFAAVPDFAVTILAGAVSGTGTFTLTPEDDSLDEADERLLISGASNLPVTGTTLTLADDDATSSGIVLAAMPSWVSEGAGSTVVTVTATLDGGARTAETVVTAAVSGSGAAGAVDFATVPDFKIAIPAEATSGTGTFTLDPEDDGVDEVDEALTVTGVADLPVTAAALTLADDDATSSGIVLAAMPSWVSEGSGSTVITVTATLDGASADRRDGGDGGSVGERRCRRGGLRHGTGLQDRDSRRGDERDGDLRARSGRRRRGRGGRGADGDGRCGPAGDGGRTDAGGRRRDLHEHPALGVAAQRVGRRRHHNGDGDGDAGRRSPGRRDKSGSYGVGERRCRCGGCRDGAGFRTRDSPGSDERDGNVYAPSGRRQCAREQRNAHGRRRGRPRRDGRYGSRHRR